MDTTQFCFLVDRNDETHIHADIELFFVIDGSGYFTLEKKRYHMKKEDFIIVNPNQKHSFHTLDKDFLAASLKFSYSNLRKMLKKDMFFFVCNSAVEENEFISEIRVILKKIVNEQYYHKRNDDIYMNSLYFDLLHRLTTDFLLRDENQRQHMEDHKFDDRKYKIADYVQQNYDKDISLKDLADKLFLSNAYLSKYIKRQFGMNFIEYVNSVRLNYAVSQLLYSDKPLGRIAMDTGFASSTALNRTFKDKYHMTPTEYRIQWKGKEDKKRSTVEMEERIHKQTARYFEGNKGTEEKEADTRVEYAILQEVNRTPLDKNWSRLINIGSASDLLHSDVQQHVLYLKNTLHFRYVRFWDLYSSEIMLNGLEEGEYNFDKLDRILDFLTKNDLLPYIELRNKPKILIQNSVGRLQPQGRIIDRSKETIEVFMRKLIIHLINRYTTVEVEKWYFEVWKTEREEYQNVVEIADKAESIPMYLDVFDTMAGTLRKYLPDIQIGGGGFALRWGEEHFLEMMEAWKRRENLPDFISMYCYPYTVDSIALNKSQTLDSSFVKKELTRIRDLLQKADFPVRRLHVTEWSFSVSSRNFLNDHCMKGAYLVKSLIDSVGLAELMGYWVGSDLYSDYFDSKWILNGGGGLISKDGIPKPAYYAIEFMNHLGKYFIKSGKHYILTDNGKGNYRIVCHNLKKLGYQYGLIGEDKHILDNVNNLFTDMKKHRIHFELPAKPDGKYMMRIYSINQKYGSILDEWAEMSGEDELNPGDMNYLERITTPRLVHLSCEEHNGKIRFNTVLEPNEIQFIHVTIKYV